MTTVSTPAPSGHPDAPAMLRLTDLKVNGTSPFWSDGDGAHMRLTEAHAILTMLADRHNLAQDLYTDRPEEAGELRNEISARALEGVATLIALALHHSECASVALKSTEASRG